MRERWGLRHPGNANFALHGFHASVSRPDVPLHIQGKITSGGSRNCVWTTSTRLVALQIPKPRAGKFHKETPRLLATLT